MPSVEMAALLRELAVGPAGSGWWEVLGRGSAVLGLDGLALSLCADEDLAQVAFHSDPRAAQAEDLQFVHGQGPSLEAFALNRVSLTGDLATCQDSGGWPRWPGLAGGLLELGVRAVFTVPVRLALPPLPPVAVLSGYRTTHGDLSGRQTADLLVLAAGVGRIVQALATDPTALTEWVERAGHYRAPLHRAAGHIAARLHIPPAQALSRIRAHAYGHNQPLMTTVHSILANTSHATRDSGPDHDLDTMP